MRRGTPIALRWRRRPDYRDAGAAIDRALADPTRRAVVFEPSATGTLVTVTHRGWAALRGDHPVRHGQDAPRLTGQMGGAACCRATA